MQTPCPENNKSTVTSEAALQFIATILESKTGKQLTPPEKEILKAAWENETYSSVAENLYLSVGYIKDIASLLWQRLSDACGEKITKNNLRRVIETLSTTSPFPKEEIPANDIAENTDTKVDILIVDELIENLHFLTDVLTEHTHKVRSVTTGNGALRSSIRNHPPDIILLDIKMIENEVTHHAIIKVGGLRRKTSY